MLECCHLDGKISDGGALAGTEDDLQTGAFRRELIEQNILAATAHNEKPLEFLSGDLADGKKDFGVTLGHTVKNGVGDKRNVGKVQVELRLTESFQLRINFIEHVTGEHEFRFVYVDECSGRGQRSAT